MHRHIFLLSSLALLTCAPMTFVIASSRGVEAYEDKTVGKIDIYMENLPPEALFNPKPVLGKLETKVGDPFSQGVFDADLKTLSEDYDRIEPSIEIVNGDVYISIKVWARPRISKIVWKGNKQFSSKSLQKELGIKAKKVFNVVEFNKAFNKVKEYYIKKGYFESQLSYQLIPNLVDNTVDIEITVMEGISGLIDDIVFQGFSPAEKAELLNMVYTKKYHLLTSWLTGGGIYNEEAVEQDKLTIVNFMQNHGYADAKVDIITAPAKAGGKIILYVTVDKGPMYHFGSVTFRGNSLFTDKEVEDVFLARPEGIYSPEKLRNTVQAIKELYGRKGYIDTNVQFEAIPLGSTPVYNIEFIVEEGQQYKIGMIKIFGNVQTESHVILRESLLTPGDVFDSAKLKRTQQRLENIGYFKSVNVYAVRTQDDQDLGENYRDVYIEVEETTTGHLSLFFGFSSGDGVFGGLDLTETNFNYKGLGKMFSEGPSALRGGGEYAHAKATLGAKQRSYTISWLTPYFRDTLWRVGFDLFISQTHNLEAKKYAVDSLGGSLYASYPLTAYWAFGWKYRFKHASIDVKHNAPAKEQEDRTTGNVSATSVSLNFDSTDSMGKPHNGLRSMFETEFAGVGGTYSFLKYSALNTYYQELWSRGVMKYRADFKFIQPTIWTKHPHDIPISERFFAGGENTVRGYKPYDLGSHYSDGDPTGGISYSVLSVEYLQEILKILDAFVFADAGSVSLSKFEIAKYNMSWGVGIRLEIMNRMPIILGYGWPVNPSDKKEVQKFFFQMGGQF